MYLEKLEYLTFFQNLAAVFHFQIAMRLSGHWNKYKFIFKPLI